jgi:hypothetical protein
MPDLLGRAGPRHGAAQDSTEDAKILDIRRIRGSRNRRFASSRNLRKSELRAACAAGGRNEEDGPGGHPSVGRQKEGKE